MLNKMRQINPYVIAVLSVFTATVLTQLLHPLLASVSFTLFYAAIAITAWVGGAKPGLLAIFLSLLFSDYFFLHPDHSFAMTERDDLARLSLIAFVSLLINHFISELRGARLQIQQLSDRRLQESGEQLQLALQAAHMGMWNWNLVTGEITWTPEHEQLLGLALGTFDGRYETFDARLHPGDRDGLNHAVQTAIQEQRIYKHEYRVIWPDGSIHWVEGRGQTFCDEAGKPVRMTGTLMNVDDRKQLEFALKQSEQQFRAIFEAEPECVKVVTANGVLHNMNPAGLAMLEADSLEQVQGQCVCSLIEPDHQQAFLEFTQHVAHGKTATLEFEITGLKGTRRWLESHAVPLQTPDEADSLVLAVTRDITEQKRAKEVIQRSEERYRSLVTATFQIVWTSDANGNTTSVSPAWFDLTGQTWDNLPQWGWVDYLHPDDRDRTVQVWKHAVATQTSYDAEYRLRAKDGSYRDFKVRGVPVKNPDNRIREWVGTLTDITEQKQAEIALRESEEKLRLLIQHAPVSIAMFDCEMHYISVSQQWVDDYKLDPVHTLIGRSHYEIFPEIPERWRQIHQHCLAGAIEKCDDDLFVRTDGEQQWVSWEVRPWYTATGNIGGIILFAVDVTKRKQAEVDLQQYKDIFQFAEHGLAISRGSQLENVNPAFARMHGYSVEEMVNKPVLDLFPTERHAETIAFMQKLNEVGHLTHESSHLCKDGTTFPILLDITVVKDPQGNPAYRIVTALDITERKQAEAEVKRLNAELEQRVAERTVELQRTNTLLNNFFNAASSAGIGLCIHDHNLRFVQINEALAVIDGHSIEAHLGKTVAELLPELAPTVTPLHQYVLTTGQPIIDLEITTEVPSQPGVKRYWLASYFPILGSDSDAQTVGVGVIITEISDRKQAENALRVSQARLAGILDNANDAIISVDSDQCITLFNQGAEKIFGYVAEEVIGQPLNLLLPTRFATVHRMHVEQFRESGSQARRMGERTEVYGRHKDGTEFPAEASISKLDLNGEQTITAFLRDITQRKQSEATSAQLASIVESSDEAIISKTLEGIVISWNASAERLFGYSAEEMIGHPMTKIIPADRLEEEVRIMEHFKRGERIDHHETVRQRKDGTLIEIAITISPIRDASGKVIGASKIAHDITEQRAVERMKAEFISIVSHELRTPLTSISGALELLSTGLIQPESDRGQETIGIAATEADRLTRLVNDILALERLESGKIRLEHQPWDLALLMTRAVDFMQLTANQMNITLLVEPLSVILNIDGDRILQVLTNLLSNAVKFSPNHTTIWLTAEIYREHHILITVRDQGRGIPANKLESIFERFQQVDASDSRKKGGTGLGLAICRSIVQQHGGAIWAESVLEQGSRFHFTLPLTTDA